MPVKQLWLFCHETGVGRETLVHVRRDVISLLGSAELWNKELPPSLEHIWCAYMTHVTMLPLLSVTTVDQKLRATHTTQGHQSRFTAKPHGWRAMKYGLLSASRGPKCLPTALIPPRVGIWTRLLPPFKRDGCQIAERGSTDVSGTCTWKPVTNPRLGLHAHRW